MDDMTINIQLGQWLRHQRKLAGLTLQELSTRIGTSYQQLQKYESGKNSLTLAKLLQLARSLECRAEDVIGQLFPIDRSEENEADGNLYLMIKYFRHLSDKEKKSVLACTRILATARAS